MFLWNSCFFNYPTDSGNRTSSSSAFSKPSLNIRKVTVYILLKPGLENFEHYFTIVWDECSCAVVWALFGIAFLRDRNENYLFQSCGHCWVFQICWHIECSIFTASRFRVWNSSIGIPSPPLALFIVMLPKAHLTSHSRMPGSGSVITPSWKKMSFHYRGLGCKSRKSRNTWSNTQIWPWSTEWSRPKANRVLPRECTGHSKHPLPTTQEKTLQMDTTRWSIPK